jgi:hypothetical protein
LESYGNGSFLQDEKLVSPGSFFAKQVLLGNLELLTKPGDDFQLFIFEPLKDFDIPDPLGRNHPPSFPGSLHARRPATLF